MALLTRFTSTSATPAAIDTTQASAASYSQAANASLQGTDEFFRTLTAQSNNYADIQIQQEGVLRREDIAAFKQAERQKAADLKEMERMQLQQQKEMEKQIAQQQKTEAAYYAANVNADLSVKTFQALRQAKAEVQPGGDAITPVIGSLDQSLQQAIKDAPNDLARQHLIKSFIPYRTRVAQQAQGIQNELNDTHLLNGLADSSKSLSSILTSEPHQLATVQDMLQKQAEALKGQGVAAKTVDSALAKHKDTLNMVAGLSMAQQNPEEIIAELDKGGFQDLGAHTVQAMRQKATGVINQNMADTAKDIEAAQKSVMAGLTPQHDLKTLNERANHYGLTDKAQALNLFTQLDASSRGLTLAQLEQQKFDVISKAAQSPTTTPEQFASLNKFYDSRLKGIRADPFFHAAQQGVIPDGTLLPKINPGDDPNDPAVADKIKQLKIYGQEVQNHYGLGKPVVPFSAGDFENFHQKLAAQSPEEQVKSLKVLNGFGTDTMYKAAETIAPKDPGLAVAVAMQAKTTNTAMTPEAQKKQDELSYQIMKGLPLIKAGAQGAGEAGSRVKEAGVNYGETNKNVLGSMFENDPKTIGTFEKSARALSAYRQSIGAPDADYESSLKEVSGATTVKRDGWFSGSYTTIPPIRGWTGDQMSELVSKLNSTQEWQKNGNGTPHYADGTEVDFTKTPSNHFEFQPIDSHRYVVMQEVGGQKVSLKNETGQPFVMNLFKAADSHHVTAEE